jgi:hypothetical protein
MPRCLPQMDEAQDAKRVVYVSWLPDDNLSGKAQEKLMDHLFLPNADAFGRELELIPNDPTEAAGEDVGKPRKMRDEATDFVGIFTTRYLVNTKKMGKAADPDLLFFVDRKCKFPDDNLAMWILPVEQVNLKLVGFKDAAIRSLDFPWWHGWRGNDDKIPLPSSDPSSAQNFDTEMGKRVQEILSHSGDCHVCKHHP